jgi:methyl-accepting chemotaxis protein
VTEIGATVESVKGQVDQEGDGIRGASATVEEILAAIGELDEQIAGQAASVAQSSASIEEIRKLAETAFGTIQALIDALNALEKRIRQRCWSRKTAPSRSSRPSSASTTLRCA